MQPVDDHPHSSADRVRDTAGDPVLLPYESADDREIREHDRQVRAGIVRDRIDALAEQSCVGR